MKLLEEQFQSMLQKQAIEIVQNPNTPGFYSRLFLVPKKTGDLRPVIDLSALNLYIVDKPFKMETPELVRSCLSQGMWTFSIDLKDAYFHVPIHPSSRKFLRMYFKGVIYQFRALPFGIKTAPWLFTKVFREVRIMALSRDIPIHLYLDDWLGKAFSQELCRQRATNLLTLCQELGLLVNLKKSDLIPRQVFDFIGIHFNLINFLCSPTVHNLEKVKRNVTLLTQNKSLSARTWQIILGTLSSQEKLIPYGRFHVRPIQLQLLKNWNPFTGDPREQIPVTANVLQVANWWLNQDNLTIGVPVIPLAPTLRLYTDACVDGWGAHSGNLSFQGLWSPLERTLHSNVLEMRAVLLALQAVQTSPKDRVLISSDNTTVVAYINHQGGTKSKSLWEETLLLFNLAIQRKIFLRAVHIPGRLNVIADQLSRKGQVIPTEWSLHPSVTKALFKAWGTPHIDLFATRHNHKLPVFVSPVPDPQAQETDALSLNWDGLWGYAYPPHQIMSKVVSKIRQHNCQIILIAPAWPKQSWCADLLELSRQVPYKLPVLKKLLMQPKSTVFHQRPEILNLHAWLLRREPCEEEGSLKRLPTELSLLKESLLSKSMRESGECLPTGALRDILIPSRPLPL